MHRADFRFCSFTSVTAVPGGRREEAVSRVLGRCLSFRVSAVVLLVCLRCLCPACGSKCLLTVVPCVYEGYGSVLKTRQLARVLQFALHQAER